MFNVGAGELIVILLIALIVLGPDRLPDAARKMGKFMGQVRQMSNGFQTEMRQAMKVDEFSNMVNPKQMFDPTPVAKGGAGPSLPPLESEVAASNRVSADSTDTGAGAGNDRGDAPVPTIRAVPDQPEADASPAA